MQQLIGNTPLLPLTRFDTGPCELWIKMESMNPGGSIKDRIAQAMVDAAEQAGELQPGGTIVEATAGNTGIALAQIAIQRGYQLLLVIPDKMSLEKINHVKALGAEVVITRSDVNRGHPEYYQDYAARLAEERDNAWYADQFSNPANPDAHQHNTAPEIWQQTDGKLDAIVYGAGTGGHLTGISRFFAETAPHVEHILADPYGSILSDTVLNGPAEGEHGKWVVEGIGQDYVPATCDLKLASSAIRVNDHDALRCTQQLLRQEGIFAGTSTGLTVHAALTYCRQQTHPKRVVTFAYDSGNKYLSKAFNPEWLTDKGFADLVD